jgi:hypothetical protein
MSYYGSDGPGPAADPWEHSAPVYDVDLGYPQPPPREPASSKVLLVVLVSVLVVVLCGGGVAALYLIGKSNPPAATGGSPTPPAHSPSASQSPALDPNTVLKGDCLVNKGNNDAPELQKVPCTPGTLKVLQKIDATSDKDRCKTVPGADQVYYYKTTPDSLSFVLCLQTVS